MAFFRGAIRSKHLEMVCGLPYFSYRTEEVPWVILDWLRERG